MHPRHHAATAPERLAVVMAGSGESITYGALDEAANRGAQLFRVLGLKAGDAVAVLLPNSIAYFEVYWAAQRSGLYITPISTRLTPAEAAYIVTDSNSKILVTCDGTGNGLVDGRDELIPGVIVLAVGGSLAGAANWHASLAEQPPTRIGDETAGFHMVYSSGTTGRPKGIKLPLSGGSPDAPHPYADRHRATYGADENTRYLSPAPLYHTAPLVFCTLIHCIGGTVVVMEKFDAEAFLAAIEIHRITFTQVVPTMFVRLLKLPQVVRQRYDVASLKTVVHAAAPCPVPVKRQMLEWLGPIIFEYYGGSEANGSTAITGAEWLKKPGSVGRASWGTLHICREDGSEADRGETGVVYFEGGLDFRYHNDDAKSASARHPVHKNWTTLGDIGHVDDDGYLFLTDRKAFMIISGGVNVYPQETENLLITHPKVADAAVFGVPNADLGEEVKAVIQPLDWADAGPGLEMELIAFCRENLAGVKCPRSIDFERELPRGDNGKLYKRPLRDRYWTSSSPAG